MAYQLRTPNNLDLYGGSLTLNALDQNGNLIAPFITESNVYCENIYVERARFTDATGNIVSDELTIIGSPSIGNVLTGISTTEAEWLAPAAFSGAITGSSLVVNGLSTFNGNVVVNGWIDVQSNISMDGDLETLANITAEQYTSLILYPEPPLVISSNVEIANLNAEFSGLAAAAQALQSLTTEVNVSLAAAPTVGQILTAIDGSNAEWSDPETITGNLSIANLTVDDITANSITLVDGLIGTGNIDLSGWINTDSNISVGTDGTIGGNLLVTGWIASSSNISAIDSISTAQSLISTVATGTSPILVSSTTQVANLKAETSGTSDTTNALESATTTIDVSASAAPTIGMALIADSSTSASWQVQSSGVVNASSFSSTSYSGGTSDTLTGSSSVWHYVDNSSPEVNTITLPTAVSGMTFGFYNRGDGDLIIKVASGATYATLSSGPTAKLIFAKSSGTTVNSWVTMI